MPSKLPAQATPHVRAHLAMHLCVVLWGGTAILGRLITLPATAIVLFRMWFVTLVLLFLPRVRRGLRELSRDLWRIYAVVGVLVAAHWITFYGAIKLANASVAASCLSIAPVVVALLAPLVTREPFELRQLWLGVWVIPGVLLIAGGSPLQMRAGVVLGVVSALLDACFSVLNKRHVSGADPLVITCVEMGAGALALTCGLLATGHHGLSLPNTHDLWLLLWLSIACTLVPYTLSLWALRELSAFVAQLIVNLEPVYAIALGALLLAEQRDLSAGFYLGAAIIVSALLVQPSMRRVAS